MARRPQSAPPPAANEHIRKISPYPPGKPIEEVKREYGLDSVIKLASNENPLGPSPRALKAIAMVAGEMHLYPDGTGYYLKQKLAGRLGVAPEWLILGNGSDEISGLLAMAYLNPGRGLVTSNYAFVRYTMAAELVGAPTTRVPMKEMRHNLSAIARAITSDTALVCLDIPCNPTGTIVSRREMTRFLAQVPPGVVVLLDQAYHEFAENDPDYPNGLELFGHFPNLVVTRTFSKSYGLAGLRIGYGVARPEIIQDLDRVRPPFNASRMAQAAALAALDDKAHLRRTVQNNRKGLDQLQKGFSRLGLKSWTSSANFILVDVGRNGPEAFHALLQRGVVTRPMAGYGLMTHLRISVGTAEENKRCIEALGQVLST